MTDLPVPGAPDGPGYLEGSRRAPAERRGEDRRPQLTPEETAARRRNRRWILAISIPSIVVLGLALLASGVAQSNAPSGPRLGPPPGYQVVDDGYFSYALPVGWKLNQLYTDNAGDVDRSGPGGWAAEHIGFRDRPPAIGEVPPKALAAFGVSRLEPIELTGGHPGAVPGAAAAVVYEGSRPGGFRATVIDAWSSRSGVELWLVVAASPDVTTRIVGSLRS